MEAQTNQTMAVYDDECSLREHAGTSALNETILRSETPGRAPSPTVPLTPSLTTCMEEMTEQVSQLTLLLQAGLNGQSCGIRPSGVINAPTMGTANITRPLGDHIS